MIVEQSTGATSRETVDWHSIDWKKAHKIVDRLQARIVQATKAGKRNKVKALQRILTHSFSGKALAVKRVTENQGKNTPGVDKILWNTPEKKAMAVQELQSRGYTAQPLRRMYLPKPNGKQRPLGIPTMKDRGMQALYLQALDPIAETQADTHSYGFRKERSCADAITQCYRVLFREAQLAVNPHSNGGIHPGKVAQSRLHGEIRLARFRRWHATRRDHLPSPGQYDARRVGKTPSGEVPN